MPKYELTASQVEKLKARFGELMDVEAELKSARDYATDIHAGRPYGNYGRFCWNWCLRAERWQRERRATRYTPAAGRVEDQAPLPQMVSREQLEAMLQDDSTTIRELAAEELKRLDSQGEVGKH